MTRFLLAVLLLWSSAAAAQDAPATAPSEEMLLQAADEIAQKVALIRGLEVKEPVHKGIKQREELRAVLIQKLAEEVSDADVEAEAAVFKRLGVIPQDLDYKKILLDVLTEQIAGFYDQKAKELYIMQGIPLSLQRPAMAHELFHAIQDQHFDIERMQEPFKTTQNSDFALARSALLEGDATVLMFDFTMYESGQLPAGDQTSLVDIPMMANILRNLDFNSLTNLESLGGAFGGAGFSAGDSALAKAPAIFRESLVFPYFAGMRFIVMARTQRTWKDVDEIYVNPPVSTEQILHPERYFAGDDPEFLEFDASAPFAGWNPMYDSVIGEFQLTQFLKAHPVDGVDVGTVALGWDGDRIYGYTDPNTGRTAVVFLSSWDSVADAREFYDAAVKISQKRYPAAKATEASGKHGQSTCLGLDGERLYVEQWGDLVLYVEGAPSALDESLRETDPTTYKARDAVFQTLVRRPFTEVMNERLAAGAAR